MENKIEIIPRTTHHKVVVDGRTLFKCFGDTKEEAESNARIAAKGYLVEELVDMLTELWLHVKLNNEDARTGNYHPNSLFGQVDELLTKAKL